MQKQVDPFAQLIVMRASGEITADEYKLAREYLTEEIANAGLEPSPELRSRIEEEDRPQHFLGIDWEMLSLKTALGLIGLVVVLGLVASQFSGVSNSGVQAKASSPASANDPCLTAATAVARSTGGTVGQRTGLGSITISHRATSEVHVFCADGQGKAPLLAGGTVDAMSVFARPDQSLDSYFDFFSHAASELTAYNPAALRSAAQGCLRDAMASQTGIIYRNIERHGLMCDGGPKWGRPYDISIEGAFPQEALSN